MSPRKITEFPFFQLSVVVAVVVVVVIVVVVVVRIAVMIKSSLQVRSSSIGLKVVVVVVVIVLFWLHESSLWAQAFSSFSTPGLLLWCVGSGACVLYGCVSCCGAQALEHACSIAVARSLSSCSLWAQSLRCADSLICDMRA